VRIRRKLPRPVPSAQPAYVVGYSPAGPTFSDLRDWFDLEYGGPLKLSPDTRLHTADGKPPAPVLAAHGPWSAALHLAIPQEETDAWREGLGWGHRAAAKVIPTNVRPREASDQVLHVARLARGLTLLTDGTAYDTTCQTFLNPSDWRDRPLDRFKVMDHLTIEQTEVADSEHEWFLTRGLAKFGLDEVETLRPIGLPSQPVLDILAALADELVRIGQSPKVGTTLTVPALRLPVEFTRHRTVARGAVSVSVREVRW
jgi:hypothetical protein